MFQYGEDCRTLTHDLSLFISPDLNGDNTELIETASGEQIETRGSGTIDLEVGKNSRVTVSKVHYCPELNSNLLSLGVLVLEERGLNFEAKTLVDGLLMKMATQCCKQDVKITFTH